MNKTKSQKFVTELIQLCEKYKISISVLGKIVKQLKDGRVGTQIEIKEEELNGKDFWGNNVVKVIKRVMKKKLF